MSVQVLTGHGYGPVTITFPSLTVEGLRANTNRDGEVPVLAWCPNAGDARDSWNEQRMKDALGDHWDWLRERTFLTPVEYVTVQADDEEGLALAAEVLRELHGSFAGLIGEDEWDHTEKCVSCMEPRAWQYPEDAWCEVHTMCRDCDWSESHEEEA